MGASFKKIEWRGFLEMSTSFCLKGSEHWTGTFIPKNSRFWKAYE